MAKSLIGFAELAQKYNAAGIKRHAEFVIGGNHGIHVAQIAYEGRSRVGDQGKGLRIELHTATAFLRYAAARIQLLELASEVGHFWVCCSGQHDSSCRTPGTK